MPFAPHIRVTANGRLGTSGERFQYGLCMANTETPSLPGVAPPANADIWADVAADIRAFHIAAGSAINSMAVLEFVKVAAIGPDGKYTEDPTIVDVVDAPGAGVSANILPQAALAVSLLTARRGPTGRGRFYIPMPTFAVDSAMLISQTNADSVRTSAAALLNALNNQPGVESFPSFRVVVASTKGYNTAVTGVRVGRVVDTIQTRRAAIPETYNTAAAVNN